MRSGSRFDINIQSLLSLSSQLNEGTDESFILNSALLSLMGKLKIFRAAVLLPDENFQIYSIVHSKGKHEIKYIPFFKPDSVRELNSESEAEAIMFLGGYRTCVPVNYNQELLALICLGNKPDNSNLTQSEKQYADMVSTILANALQHARVHRSLLVSNSSIEQRNQLLTTLFELNRDFSTLLSRDQILRMLSYHLMGQLMVNRFSVYLIDKDDNFELIINRSVSIPSESCQRIIPSLEDTQRIDIDEENQDKASLYNSGARVLSPMIVHGDIKGLLVVGKKMNGEDFSDENIQFIKALGNTAIAALENERLFHEEVEKKRMEGELNLALEIQQNLLPKDTPKIEGFSIDGISIPSQHVGGDYFDYINLSHDRLLIAIADVSGKGMPAALLMANVQAALRVLASVSLNLPEFVSSINNLVYRNTTPDKFVTLFCAILDTKAKTIRYVNAGHNPPLICKGNKQFVSLTVGGMILGVLDGLVNYKEGLVQLDDGEVLVLYTDGVSEAMDENMKEFGVDRLKEVICNNYHSTATDIKEAIIRSVKEFSHDNLTDDLTLVVVKC